FPFSYRQILLYLTATRLVLGKPPSSQLLQDYNLDGLFGDLISAASVGNFAEYEHLLQMRCTWLMRYRLYGIMKYRLKVAMFRNLMKNTWMALNQTRTISFWQFWNACVFAGAADFTIEDAECILVTLVDLGYMKGYLNHAKGVVVLSASPFPPMYEVYK
ncbi:PCI domain-containing protein 2, partial [Chytriomyces hyalinus]